MRFDPVFSRRTFMDRNLQDKYSSTHTPLITAVSANKADRSAAGCVFPWTAFDVLRLRAQSQGGIELLKRRASRNVTCRINEYVQTIAVVQTTFEIEK